MINLIHFHRLSFFFYKIHLPFLSKPFELFIFLLYNCRIPCSVRIGQNTTFAYSGIGCVLHKDTIIGKSCIIGQGITVGGRGPRKGVPKIGDNVYLGPGARILGPIVIGDNCVIGANAVVINDVPSGSVVVGIPGKIVNTGISDISEFL